MALNPTNDPDERDRFVDPLRDDPLLPASSSSSEPEDDLQIDEDDDGGATVTVAQPDPAKPAPVTSFDANLAEKLDDEGFLQSLATTYLDLFDLDKETRKERDEQYADGIKRTGVGGAAPGGADFEGASRATHPVLMEGCIEFSARAMKELFPANGPVRTYVFGEQTPDKLQKAERKKEFMNWQLRKQIREYRPALEQTLTQVPLGGSQFKKFFWHAPSKRIKCEFVGIDHMLVPAAAADFYSAERKTQIQNLTQKEFQDRVDSGLYFMGEKAVGAAPLTPETSSTDEASAVVEGLEVTPDNVDGVRTVYESHCVLEVPGDSESKGALRPYVLTIDETNRQVVGLYRNWEPEDKKDSPDALEWFVEYGFIPWRGPYKIGLMHIIGGLSIALTGTLRALLDSAHLNNAAAGVFAKQAGLKGKNITASPTEMVGIDLPPGVDDIRKVAMPFPYNPPSNVLFGMLDWLTAQAKGVVTTAAESVKDMGADMPVGTALAIIEQGSVTFSAVHSRLHASQDRALNIVHRLNAKYLDDETTIEELGDLVVKRSDFLGPMDVQPVSDPNIYSDAQRYAQNQAVIALAEKFPQHFNIPQLCERALILINYPAYRDVLLSPGEPRQLDAITENAEASEPQTQLKAYSNQDHLGHLKAHVLFMVSPMFCANPFMGLPALPKLIAHCKEHLLALYGQHARAAAQMTHVMYPKLKESDAIVQGMGIADQHLAEELQELMPHLQQAQQLAQQMMPPPPTDPRAMAQMQINKDKIQADTVENDKDRQLQLELKKADSFEDHQDRQWEKDAAAAAQQAENERNAQEMAVAARDAEIAAQAERDERTTDMWKAQFEAASADHLAQFQGRVQLMIAEMNKKREEDLNSFNQAVEAVMTRFTEHMNLIRNTQEHQHALQLQALEQRHEEALNQANNESAEAQAKSAAKSRQPLAEGGSVLPRPARKIHIDWINGGESAEVRIIDEEPSTT